MSGRQEEEKLLQVKGSKIGHGVQRISVGVGIAAGAGRSSGCGDDGDPGIKIFKECCWITDLVCRCGLQRNWSF